MNDLRNPIYNDDDKAREHLEAIRWPHGAVCPHCESVGNSAKLQGKSTRPGVHKCRDCTKPFSVTVGTVFERSKIPLSKWLLAVHLLSSSKKGMSAHQLHRMLGLTYKTAWFLSHRIREAMKEINPPPMGDDTTPVQADETYFGKRKVVGKRTIRGKPGHSSKMSVFGLVSGGKSRTFSLDRADSATIGDILRKNVNPKAELHTDESPLYKKPAKEFAAHKTVKHTAHEYVRDGVHTNSIENYFSVFKRGMKGVYQHCSEKHLQRYLAEFDFRYNERKVTDTERSNLALKGIEGKRLTYRRTSKKAA